MFYAVDPGKKKSSVAAFREGELVGVYMVPAWSLKMQADQLGTVVVEMPRAYPGSPVRVNDLIDLAAAGMAVASKLSAPGANVRQIYPAEWKAQVPKKICQKRIDRVLSIEERARMVSCMIAVKPSLRHNLWDAIGIGLFALGRVKRGCV